MHEKEELIRKLFHEQCSREELDALFKLIQHDQSPTGPEIMEKLFEQLEEIPTYEENVFTRIKEKIHHEVVDVDPKIKPLQSLKSRSQRSLSWGLKIAASLLVFATLSWMAYQLSSNEQIHEQTALGEIKQIELPDGSSVMLNGNSSLRYASNWDASETRKVYLEGEAFFSVEKKPLTQAKFQVLTQGLTVEVLGTSFNVNHRDAATSVFLEEGKVKIKAPEKEILLNPSEIIHFSSKAKTLSAPQKVSGNLQTSWKTGMLVFEEATVYEILNRLSEFNELSFEIKDDSLKDIKLTTAVPAYNTPEALSILAKTTGISVTQKDGKFLLQSESN